MQLNFMVHATSYFIVTKPPEKTNRIKSTIVNRFFWEGGTQHIFLVVSMGYLAPVAAVDFFFNVSTASCGYKCLIIILPFELKVNPQKALVRTQVKRQPHQDERPSSLT